MNEKILVIGYEIDKPNFYLTNLMINFAEYVIYRNHVKGLKRGARVYAKGMFYELKSDLTFYLNWKANLSIDKNQVERFLDML